MSYFPSLTGGFVFYTIFTYIQMFNPNFITRIVTTLAILPISLGAAPQAAEAAQCVNGRGYTMCFEEVSRNGRYNRWNVAVQNAQTTEYMNVTCNGKAMSNWNSRGGFSQSEARQLAVAFCSL